jgi:prepilin-type N-terminal cleavage/methylation domain-containing protein
MNGARKESGRGRGSSRSHAIVASARDTRRDPRAMRGTTLIELLVVIGIVAVLALAVGATLAAGIRVWDRAREGNAFEAGAMMALDSMERDLANAVKFTSLPFRGTRQDLAVPTLIEGETLAAPRIGTVQYGFSPRNGELRRTVWPFPDREPTDGGGFTVAIRGLGGFSLSYGFLARDGSEIEWRTEATNLPIGVRATVTMTNGMERLEWQRTFRLPLGGA